VIYDREYRLMGAQVAADGQWRFPGTDTINEKFSIALMEGGVLSEWLVVSE
jgi:penicillin-binding protein 1C